MTQFLSQYSQPNLIRGNLLCMDLFNHVTIMLLNLFVNQGVIIHNFKKLK